MTRTLAAALLVLAAVPAAAPAQPALPPSVLPAQAGGDAPGVGAPTGPGAAEAAQVAPLTEALAMPDLLGIMRQEGLDYAGDIAADMFPGRGGARWRATVEEIYDTARMRREVRAALAERLAPPQVDALVQFFDSDLGRRIVGLEISARRALLDPSVEEAAEQAAAELEASGDSRFELLRAFVEANDLVEMNVVGALNSNWAFYQGLDAGGAFDGRLSEERMLADVWGQEEQIRAETREWVYSYLGLAYRPLSDDELAAYTALSETPEGRALNTALFAAFDAMFTRISRDLGLAAATFLAGEDI